MRLFAFLLSSFIFHLSAAADDAAVVFKALDEGDIETLKKFTPAKLVEIIRAGRPVNGAEPGEVRATVIDAFDRETELFVIVPKSYDRTKPAGVLIVLHGLGGDGKQLKDTLYRKFADGENYIIAAPTAQKEPKGRENEDYEPLSGDRLPHWWSYRPDGFELGALSELKRKYSIDESRVVLTGYSMGGFGTWNLGLRYPDRFSALVPFAGGISRREYLNAKGDAKMRPLLDNASNVPVYFVHGSADRTVPVTFDRKSRDRLKELGYAHEYAEVDKGGHILDVREGGTIMSKIHEWLRPKIRQSHPKKVVHYAIGSYAALSYWVRIDEIGGADGTARVEAEIKDGNVVEVKATGAKKLTIYLDEKHVDLAKPVKVVCEGKSLFSGRVEESVGVVLESWKLREDRRLLYRAKVTVDIP